MQMLDSIKQNSQSQLQKYRRSRKDLLQDPYKVDNVPVVEDKANEAEDGSDYAKQFAKMPGGLLSNIMNPKNVASILTIDTGPYDRNQKVYVQTVAGLTQANSRKKKITII